MWRAKNDLDVLTFEDDTSQTLEERKFRFEQAKARLELEKLRNERSFPKKWGPVLVSFVIGGLSSYIAFNQYQLASDTTSRQQAEWGLKVVEMVVKNESFDATKKPEEAGYYWTLLKNFAPPGIEPRQVAQRAVQARVDSAPRNADAANAKDQPVFSPETLAGAAQLQQAVEGGGAAPTSPSTANLTVYIQFAGPRDAAGVVQGRLRALGYRTPAMEAIPSFIGPAQVRYYREEQRAEAEKIYDALGFDPSSRNANVVVVGSGKKLPANIFEVWFAPRRT